MLWLIFGGLTLLAAAVLLRSAPKGEAVARTDPAPSSAALPDVRVRHQFITIPMPAPQSSLARRTEASKPAATKENEALPIANTRREVVRTANSTSEASGPDRPDNLLIRAGRAVIGDGKYRPEPFPRIKKH